MNEISVIVVQTILVVLLVGSLFMTPAMDQYYPWAHMLSLPVAVLLIFSFVPAMHSQKCEAEREYRRLKEREPRRDRRT